MGLLEGKTLMVSGLGPGLGLQITNRAVEEGAAVVLGARSEDFLKATASEIKALGGRVAWARCDVREPEDCEQIVEVAQQRFGGLDCLVHNAFSIGPMNEPVEHADLAGWRSVFEVNVFGALQLTQCAIPRLRDSGSGSIVFVGSQIVRRVFAGRGAYAASKAAALTCAQVLARELGADGIRVNTLLPGRMWGLPFREAYRQRAEDQGVDIEELLEPVRQSMALGEIPTDTQCADVAVFLASDLSSSMTGQSIDANGGETFQ